MTTSSTAAGRTFGGRLVSLLLPRRDDYAGLRTGWRADLMAGVTVAVVALPLALGFGVTSGAGAAAGLVTAVVAGLVAALLGGSHVQVSGPTGAMTVVLVPIVARHGPEAIPAVAVMAGGLVVVAGLLGFGRLVHLVPWPVVEGFTAGIGVVIALQQVPLALGTPRVDGENAALVALRTAAATDWAAAVPSLAVVLLVVAVVLVLPRVLPAVPASLVAVVLATLVAELTRLEVERIGTLPAGLPAPSVPLLTPEATASLVPAALAVAALAALESLLSARVADGMADDQRRTDPDRELVGQGLANVASGLVGGLPATGAIARTAVNVRAGARTRLAAATHAVVLVVAVAGLAPLVARIPLPALAGVLLVTAARMVNVAAVRSIWRSGPSGALVLGLTFATTLVFDLVVAVELGVALTAVLALRTVARASGVHREEIDPDHVGEETERALLAEHVAVYRVDGALFFADAGRFLDELVQVRDVRVVVLRLSSVRLLDTSGAYALGRVVEHLERRGIVVLLKGLRPEHRRLVAAVGALDGLEGAGHLVDDLGEAIEHARQHASGQLPDTAACGRARARAAAAG